MNKSEFAKRVLFLMIVTLFLVGCNRRPSPTPETSQDIYTGTQGLNMKFLENLPPSKIYDTGSLNVLLELENKGTYDLSGSACYIYLSGFDDKIIRGIDKDKQCSSSLEGKSISNPQGSFNTQEFSTDTIELPDYLDSLPQKILATACYESQTIASPIVCIDPNYYGISPIERACKVGNVGVSGGQGAPVAVTGVGVEMAGKTKVAFNIRISNLGGGTPLSLQSSVSADCPYNINPKDFNIVHYDVDMVGGTKVRCAPEIDGDQRVRLVNGVGTLFCSFEVSGDNAYTTPLRIVLDYNYLDSLSKSIEIIKTPE